jgi:hypothetical protein
VGAAIAAAPAQSRVGGNTNRAGVAALGDREPRTSRVEVLQPFEARAGGRGKQNQAKSGLERELAPGLLAERRGRSRLGEHGVEGRPGVGRLLDDALGNGRPRGVAPVEEEPKGSGDEAGDRAMEPPTAGRCRSRHRCRRSSPARCPGSHRGSLGAARAGWRRTRRECPAPSELGRSRRRRSQREAWRRRRSRPDRAEPRPRPGRHSARPPRSPSSSPRCAASLTRSALVTRRCAPSAQGMKLESRGGVNPHYYWVSVAPPNPARGLAGRCRLFASDTARLSGTICAASAGKKGSQQSKSHNEYKNEHRAGDSAARRGDDVVEHLGDEDVLQRAGEARRHSLRCIGAFADSACSGRRLVRDRFGARLGVLHERVRDRVVDPGKDAQASDRSCPE